MTTSDPSPFLSGSQSLLTEPGSSRDVKLDFKLIQISDLHLQALPQQRYRGYNVERQLQAVLDHIAQHHADFDALLLSGDLVEQGARAGYQRLARYLERFDRPWYWIPGNHDALAEMCRIQPAQPGTLIGKGYRLVLLDSTGAADGRGGGSLSELELQRLLEQLEQARAAAESVLLVLHHNPVPVQSAWQDAIMLANAESFWQLLKLYRLPITVLYGHLHQQWDQIHQGVRLLSCPSTAVQFAKQQPEFRLETEGEASLPGYRWLEIAAQPKRADTLCSIELNQTNINWHGLKTGIERVSLA